MTAATVIPFRRPTRLAPAPAIDLFAVSALNDAEDDLLAVQGFVEIARENALAGTRREGLGPVRDGRTLRYACRLVLSLVNLRGNPETDHGLTAAVRAWLQDNEVRR